MKTQILVLSGPVGVGKTSVGEEVSEVLDGRRIPHTLIDFDQLRLTYPHIPDDPRNHKLGFQNLGAIWRNCSLQGSLNLIVSHVVGEPEFIDQLLISIPNSEVSIVQLSAPLDTLIERVEKREIGSGLECHKTWARELHESLSGDTVPCDHRVSTEGRKITDIAEEVADKMQWKVSSSKASLGVLKRLKKRLFLPKLK